MVFVRVSLNCPVARFYDRVKSSCADSEVGGIYCLQAIGCRKLRGSTNPIAHSHPVGHVKWFFHLSLREGTLVDLAIDTIVVS